MERDTEAEKGREGEDELSVEIHTSVKILARALMQGC